MTIAETAQTADTEAAALMTYSSGEKDGYIDPSKLTKLAALALRQHVGDQSVDLIIAPEESYLGRPTTGELLIQKEEYRQLLPSSMTVDIIKPTDENDRLLNTTVQVEALIDRAAERGIGSLTVVGWGFHKERVMNLFKGYADGLIAVDYIRVEDELEKLQDDNPDEMSIQLLEVGFNPGITLEDVLKRGVAEFAKREVWTNRFSLGKGRLIKWASRFRGVGRYDDLGNNGHAVIGTTETPWYRRWL